MSVSGKNSSMRSILRVAGPLFIFIGVVILIIAMVDFFSAFGSFGQPDKFYLFFLAIPFIFLGVIATSYGFMGAVARYKANELAPVAKDTINYMAEGTKDSVRTIARSIKEGISESEGAKVVCQKCGTMNASDSRFCKNCGTTLRKDKKCPDCGEQNDSEARFCDKCGFKFPA